MPARRRRSRAKRFIVGRLYGTGSLLFRARTVVAVDPVTLAVTYMAEDAPPTVAGGPGGGRGRVQGQTYTCSHKAFVRWLKRITDELKSYHGR